MTASATTVNWPLRTPPADYVLGHVRAVLPDRILDDARVVVRDGTIAAVEPHPAGSASDVDGSGMYCLPGIVDVHSDALEKERMPRPSAQLPWEFALLSFEAKLRAAGVTTVFHGACFEHTTSRGLERSIELADELCAAVDARGPAPVDHRILHRLDVRSEVGAQRLRARLETSTRITELVSHEDHTPGQGQYVDRGYLEEYLTGADGLSPERAREHVDELIESRAAALPVRDANLRWLGGLAASGRIRLAGHDPADAGEIAELRARGGAVAEFPTTRAAAAAAAQNGLPVVMGAPNVLRGTSHAGNVSARDLIAAGLVAALASDYLPSGLLAAAFLLAESIGLPAAAGLITAGPAQVAGLADRGRLEPGLRADLTLVEAGPRWPIVRAALRAES
ncbi:MAG TPA: alpha-D-ribose 1-methylphosphonate 5-triphosphate diphosphatase [Mycobacteriales bacterium]|nr:alpha-D-ribose 1-methylphosphonate 5-triphosphate diphosphatase [Mycobacteriales bacterium]